mmetsp:Transcript_130273/g.324835  ORF Transcript_130273/g.324835 Transcript_130273/m.324835 type:complete len:180 (-) Transcript_130273:29-568(-)
MSQPGMSPPPAWLMQAFGNLPGPMQQRAQVLLMRVMKDQYLPALAMLPAAWILAYMPHFVKLAVMLKHKGVLKYNNRTPRTEDPNDYGQDAGLIKRAVACHLNALESFPAFAAALVLCKIQKAKPMEVARLGLRYLAARVLYTVCYLAGRNDAVAALRTFAWFGSTHAIWRLYATALSK